jgi:hypothetical protein
MLQALPNANLIIDASANLKPFIDQIDGSYVHLFTSLSSIAELGVDQIQAGAANKVYIDLGLPTHDLHAMADISKLLSALDPANAAKLVNAGEGAGIGLVISGEWAHTIAQGGGLSAADLNHLHNLGITEINIVDPTADFSGTIDLIAQSSQEAPVVPEVKLIGIADPMFNELLPK